MAPHAVKQELLHHFVHRNIINTNYISWITCLWMTKKLQVKKKKRISKGPNCTKVTWCDSTTIKSHLYPCNSGNSEMVSKIWSIERGFIQNFWRHQISERLLMTTCWNNECHVVPLHFIQRILFSLLFSEKKKRASFFLCWNIHSLVIGINQHN